MNNINLQLTKEQAQALHSIIGYTSGHYLKTFERATANKLLDALHEYRYIEPPPAPRIKETTTVTTTVTTREVIDK